LSGYLALVEGRGSLGELRHAAPTLVRELAADAPRATPAQQRYRSRVRKLGLGSVGAPSARAVAILQSRGGPPYPLVLYLERRGTRWLVTRIGDA
jgi:hypothetical protein